MEDAEKEKVVPKDDQENSSERASSNLLADVYQNDNRSSFLNRDFAKQDDKTGLSSIAKIEKDGSINFLSSLEPVSSKVSTGNNPDKNVSEKDVSSAEKVRSKPEDTSVSKEEQKLDSKVSQTSKESQDSIDYFPLFKVAHATPASQMQQIGSMLKDANKIIGDNPNYKELSSKLTSLAEQADKVKKEPDKNSSVDDVKDMIKLHKDISETLKTLSNLANPSTQLGKELAKVITPAGPDAAGVSLQALVSSWEKALKVTEAFPRAERALDIDTRIDRAMDALKDKDYGALRKEIESAFSKYDDTKNFQNFLQGLQDKSKEVYGKDGYIFFKNHGFWGQDNIRVFVDTPIGNRDIKVFDRNDFEPQLRAKYAAPPPAEQSRPQAPSGSGIGSLDKLSREGFGR